VTPHIERRWTEDRREGEGLAFEPIQQKIAPDLGKKKEDLSDEEGRVQPPGTGGKGGGDGSRRVQKEYGWSRRLSASRRKTIGTTSRRAEGGGRESL